MEKPLDKSLLSFDAEYFQNLLQRNNSSTLQYLPSASYFTQYLPMLKNRVFGDVSADLTNFWRPQGDKATRFIATPSMHVPYSWEGLNFLTSASLIEKAYSVAPTSPDANQMLHQEAASVQADANMKFMKDTSTDLFSIGQMQSIIMPRLQYNYFQNTSSPYKLPTLDLRDQTLNANTVTYSFNHYLNAVKDDNVRESVASRNRPDLRTGAEPAQQPFPLSGPGRPLLSNTYQAHPFPYQELLVRPRRIPGRLRQRFTKYGEQYTLCRPA